MVESSAQWRIGEHLDILDRTGRWCNGEISKVHKGPRTLQILYTGMQRKTYETL